MRRWWAGIAAGVTAAATATGVLAAPGSAVADPDQPPALPVFTPTPTDWSPHMDFWPYNTFTYQVTPEMIGGMSDSCQWFNAQFDPLLGQINAFNRSLGAHHDVYAEVQPQADAVVANIDRSTGFLGPRLQPLTIRNTPDNYGPYSPIYGGEQLTGVLFQLSRIADSMRKKQPAGFTRPHIDSAAGWGDALRNSGACT
ncbi:hypothetical protein EHH44_20470 [Mycolicibacter terrae]|uniref:Uncharacterized protein n=2 Tax=Mycolicibacter TaxID=1073531 RepID=A0A1A2Y9R7_MYCSD|nr:MULTISPECIES: hypothetical protein [Mycolicibacter]OBH19594.1 hypothetical protein A5694_18395 [Mycolicibacter sinensis]OBI34188.1 hypothetical protein A5710_12115 [Mycolicibacter sinensis]RRR40408.1 hypothetical protein EHH44_20470 [Mycolicibacter terrae]